MANYVKFRRGNIDNFNKATADADTLYFIYSEDELSAELYLGSKKISGGDGTNVTSLSELTDILLSENITTNDLLIYNGEKWQNKSLEEIFNNYIINVNQNVKVVENDKNNNHLDLIEEQFAKQDPRVGDIVIIKDIFANNLYQHTAYIFDNNHWQAMDGNYNAENIYFNNDFVFTENIGTITIPESGNIVVSANGKNLKEFLSTIFAAEKDPEVTLPSAKIILGAASTSFEVGSNYSPSYTINFDDGNYSYGPELTGVIASYNVSDTNNNTSTEIGASFEPFEILDDTNYQITAIISYSDGTIPKTNLGNDCEDKKILANTLTISSDTIKGYRKSFYGALNTKEDYNIRDLKSSTSALKNGSSFTINLTATTKRVVIAYPATLRNLTSVLDKNDSNSNIVSGFGEPEIKQIKGASETSSAIDYKVYTMDFANEYGTSNVFTVTI